MRLNNDVSGGSTTVIIESVAKHLQWHELQKDILWVFGVYLRNIIFKRNSTLLLNHLNC